MATQINGKLFRNVKGADEGIVTTNLDVTSNLNISGELQTGAIYTNLIYDNESNNNYIQLATEDNAAYIVLSAPDGGIAGTADDGLLLCDSPGEDSTISLGSSSVSIESNEINLNSATSINIEGEEGVSISGGIGFTITGGGEWYSSNQGIDIYAEDSNSDTVGDVFIDIVNGLYLGGKNVTINGDHTEDGSHYIILQNLPTSDPQVEGALWNDNGVLKISAGA